MNSDKYRLKHHILFLSFIGLNQAILFWIHTVIYTTGILFVPFLFENRIYFGLILALCSVSFLVGTITLYVGHNRFLGNLYHLSAIWLGTMFWLFVGAVLVHGTYILGNDFLSDEVFTSIAVVAYVGAIVLSAYGLYHQKDIKIVRLDIEIKDLPDSWVGKKASLFTDSHYGPVHTITDAWKLAKTIEKEKPDIVFMSGDFYDGPPTNFVELGKAFKDIVPPLGKFFVTGNHEEYAGRARAIGGVEAGGFVVTDGTITMVDGVQIIGVPYESHETKAEIGDMFASLGYDPTVPSITLKHVPNDLDALAKLEVDLVLCGHTHRGQIWPLSLLTKWIYKGFDYGLKPLKEMQVYTSSGVGTWGPPQRIGTQSEMVILTFKKK